MSEREKAFLLMGEYVVGSLILLMKQGISLEDAKGCVTGCVESVKKTNKGLEYDVWGVR